MSAITKRFGATLAVDHMEFEARSGEVTALLGENGAGKSTLMKLLYGLHTPDGGRIVLDGQAVDIRSPRQGIAAGIGMVFQQFSLIAALSVRENLALQQADTPMWIGHGARRLAMLDQHLHAVAPGLDPRRRVADLPVGQMQLAELAKALLMRARCLVLDEPSATLSPPETQVLWERIRALAGRGLSVVLITHKLRDVRACADRVVVMRAGRPAGSGRVDALTDEAIVEQMVGHPADRSLDRVPPSVPPRPRLELRGLRAGPVSALDLVVQAGELVGVAGVSGNGQTALAEAVAGARPLEGGEVIVDGQTLRAPRLRRSAPDPRVLGYIPEQPGVNAVAPTLSCAVNLALGRFARLPFVLDRAALARDAAALIERFDVRPPEPQRAARTLSGGNLQKLVIARELSAEPAVVVACYPTMGLDVDATRQVYRTLFELARGGSAVLWFSEDLDDLLQFAHRIVVMCNGRLSGSFDAASASLQAIGAAMAGSSAAPVPDGTCPPTIEHHAVTPC